MTIYCNWPAPERHALSKRATQTASKPIWNYATWTQLNDLEEMAELPYTPLSSARSQIRTSSQCMCDTCGRPCASRSGLYSHRWPSTVTRSVMSTAQTTTVTSIAFKRKTQGQRFVWIFIFACSNSSLFYKNLNHMCLKLNKSYILNPDEPKVWTLSLCTLDIRTQVYCTNISLIQNESLLFIYPTCKISCWLFICSYLNCISSHFSFFFFLHYFNLTFLFKPVCVNWPESTLHWLVVSVYGTINGLLKDMLP